MGQTRAQSQTVTTFSTAGNATWTCPTGVTSVQVEAWGGGGGGGGVGENYTLGGGGAGGSYVKYTVGVTAGTVYQLTVGGGGAGGTGGGGSTNNGGNGATGGSSYFGNTSAGNPAGAVVLAVGGGGGALDNTAGNSSSKTYTASAGGTATASGNLPSVGATADTAGTNGTTPAASTTKLSGAGGSGAGSSGSAGGGAGGAGATTAQNPGNPGSAPGGGGGGGIQVTSANNGAGGAGGAGQIVLTYTAPSTPTIVVTGTPSALSGTYGTASASTSFSASGSNLTANITVTPPTGFEVSTSSSSGYSGSLTLTQSSGTVSSTTVYVRLAAATIPGDYSGNVSLASTGATTQNAAIPSSTVSPLALTVGGAAVTSKPYDGTSAATITGTLVGVVSPDVVNLVGTGTFAQVTSGTGIAVTAACTLSGANAGNYTLAQPTGLTGTILGSDNLGAVSLGSGTTTPVFSAGVSSYTAGVGNNVTSITVTPVVDPSATVTVNGVPVTSGSASGTISLGVGANIITVAVTEGGSTQDYTVTVTRAAPFTPGNVVVQQADNGSIQNTTITLVELNSAATSTQATPVQSIQLPGTNTSGSPPNALRINGSGGTTGYLATSADGTLLAVAAADATNSTDLGQTTAADIDNREIVTLNGSGDEVYQAGYTGNGGVPATGNQCRAATSLDNTTWFVADKGGIYTTSSSGPATTPDSTTNMLVTKSFGGTVYGFSATAPGVTTVASSGGSIGTLTPLPGLSIASYTDFYLIASGVNGAAYDICYVSLGTSATAGTINKYSLVSGSWVANGSYATSFGGRSMVAAGNGTGANLYLTGGNGSTSGVSVVKVTDTAGYNQTINVVTADNVVLYTFPGGSTGPVPKGIAFAPLATALPDLTISASAPTFVSSGANFNYSITVANSGAAGASGVTAQFTLPAGLTFVSAADTGSAGFNGSNNGGVVTFTGGTLADNTSETLTVTVSGPDSTYVVDAGATPATNHGFAVINTSATTSSPIAESNSSNNTSNLGATTHVGNAAALTVDVSGTSSVVANSSGGPITYTITAQNIGNAAGTGVSVQFTLPAGVAFLSAEDTGSAGFTANESGGVVTFSGGTLASGSSETLTVTAEATTSAYRITSVNLPSGAAVISAGNVTGTSSSPETVATSVTLPSGPDLVVTGTPNGPFLAGDAADTITIGVANNGTTATSGTVTLTDTFPSGITPASAMNGETINGWLVAVSGQTVTATRSDVLNCGATYPAVPAGLNYYPALTLTFSVSPGASGTLANSVAVSGAGDAFTQNGSNTDTITVGTPTALAATGNLLVTRSHYAGAAITAGTTILPNGSVASVSGAYPGVWANETPDVSFGVTAPIYLDALDPSTGVVANSTNLTSLISTQLGLDVTTSFSSKSEIGLNLTPDGKGVTFSAYLAPAETLDVSNANTPYHDDPTSPLAAHGDYQKAIVQVDYLGNAQVTPNDSYSGDNCRAAILANASDGNSYYYTAGSAGNSGSGVTGTTMTMLAQNTGIQMTLPGSGGLTTAVGEAFGTANSATGYQLGYDGLSTDKTGKDMNLRGLTLNPFNNTLYTTKGSGGSGVDTMYQIGAGGVPTAADAGSQVYTIPAGFPTTSGSGLYPFGMWFANASTLYLADEGEAPSAVTYDTGAGTYDQAIPANNPNAGLQKWVNSSSDGTGTWTRVYTLISGLNLGVPYSYPLGNGYPAPGTINSATGVPWQPANNGLRNLAGRVNADGTVTVYAITSTVSGETDWGADPNQLVTITDTLSATSLPTNESFTVLERAGGLDVLRGVALFQGAASNPAAAGNVNPSGATLNGTVNPNGTDTVAHFDYGTTTSYGTSTTTQDLGSGTSPVSFSSAALTGLQPGTQYDYRLVVVANGVTTYYANQTFTTPTQPTDTPAMPPWALAVLVVALGGAAILALPKDKRA
jgi:uncharacterized repeat protein (TIGR01451 family)